MRSGVDSPYSWIVCICTFLINFLAVGSSFLVCGTMASYWRREMCSDFNRDCTDGEISLIQSLIVVFWMMIGAPVSKARGRHRNHFLCFYSFLINCTNENLQKQETNRNQKWIETENRQKPYRKLLYRELVIAIHCGQVRISTCSSYYLELMSTNTDSIKVVR